MLPRGVSPLVEQLEGGGLTCVRYKRSTYEALPRFASKGTDGNWTEGLRTVHGEAAHPAYR